MGRIAEEEREKSQVRLECTNGAQTLVVWAFPNSVANLRTTISKKSIIIL